MGKASEDDDLVTSSEPKVVVIDTADKTSAECVAAINEAKALSAGVIVLGSEEDKESVDKTLTVVYVATIEAATTPLPASSPVAAAPVGEANSRVEIKTEQIVPASASE